MKLALYMVEVRLRILDEYGKPITSEQDNPETGWYAKGLIIQDSELVERYNHETAERHEGPGPFVADISIRSLLRVVERQIKTMLQGDGHYEG